jgi:hypothetical protein
MAFVEITTNLDNVAPSDPIAPAIVSRDYRTTDREIHVSVTVPSSHPG